MQINCLEKIDTLLRKQEQNRDSAIRLFEKKSGKMKAEYISKDQSINEDDESSSNSVAQQAVMPLF